MLTREVHTVKSLLSDIRFIDYCIGLFPQLQTRNGIKKAIKQQLLYVNDELAETGRWMQLGDVIRLVDSERNPPKPWNIPVQLMYEDEFLAVVRKPAGMVVSGNQYRTLENAMVGQLIISNEPDALKWARPVHRLDSATSGLVIFAKTSSTHQKMGEIFAHRKIEKRYHAVLTGEITDDMIFNEAINGQEAESRLKCLLSKVSLRNGCLTLVELFPITGRTHQLRIHCAQSGHPIVGDTLYGKEGDILLHKGLFLAATRLKFSHPITGVELEIAIDPPAKFRKLMEREEALFKKYVTS